MYSLPCVVLCRQGQYYLPPFSLEKTSSVYWLTELKTEQDEKMETFFRCLKTTSEMQSVSNRLKEFLNTKVA